MALLNDPTFSRFDTIPECNRHTDTRRRHIPNHIGLQTTPIQTTPSGPCGGVCCLGHFKNTCDDDDDDDDTLLPAVMRSRYV